MNELLRFTAPGQNGINILFPPKFEFVFYNDKFEMYKKGKLVRITTYDDVKEVAIIKNWQNNVIINLTMYACRRVAHFFIKKGAFL